MSACGGNCQGGIRSVPFRVFRSNCMEWCPAVLLSRLSECGVRHMWYNTTRSRLGGRTPHGNFGWWENSFKFHPNDTADTDADWSTHKLLVYFDSSLCVLIFLIPTSAAQSNFMRCTWCSDPIVSNKEFKGAACKLLQECNTCSDEEGSYGRHLKATPCYYYY